MHFLWDRLLGSYKLETHRSTYGLTESVNSFNPFRIAIHEWINLFRDLRKASRFKDQVSYIVHRPGWNPDFKTSADDNPDNNL